MGSQVQTDSDATDHPSDLINGCKKECVDVTSKENHIAENTMIKEKEDQVKEEPFISQRCSDGTFSCPTCNKTFASRSAAFRHYRNHTGEHPYTCSFCLKSFASKAGVDSHQLRIHNLNSDSALSCGECGKLFIRLSALEVHLKIHSLDKPFHCEHCGKSFTQKVSRDIHITKHTGEYNYQCSVCQKTFASQAKLNSHNFVHKPPRFTCELCGQNFVRHDTLMMHQRTHTGDRPFHCSVCANAYPTHSRLLEHMEMHSEKHQYKCPNCTAHFKQKTGLAAHIRRMHSIKELNTSTDTKQVKNVPTASISSSVSLFSSSVTCDSTTPNETTVQTKPIPALYTSQEKYFLCPQCGRKFRKKQSLKEHEKVHNESVSPKTLSHACHLCHRHFVQKSKLTAHIRTHLQEPSHECDICGKRFHRKDVYNHHMFLHTNERPFSCAHCGKAFASKFNLRAHLSTHSPSRASALAVEFQCDDCGKKFKHKNTFALHRKTHLGDFTYTCATCGKKFMKKSHFEGHLRSHASERPFQCRTCGRRFKEHKHCREHARKAHPSTFSLASLFASITNEDAQMEHMTDILCPSASATTQEQENTSSLNVSGLHNQLQPTLVEVSEATVSTTNLETNYLLSPEVNLNETSITMSTSMPSLVFSSLEPMLEEIQISGTSQFLISAAAQPSVEKSASCQLDVAGSTMSLAILSGEDTSSVLSQSLES